MEKKGPYLIKEIKSFSVGKQIWGKYLILEKIHRKTKDGKELYNLKIGDSSGDMDVVVWENCLVAGSIEIGSVIGLLGDIGTFSNRLQITAKRIKQLEEDPLSYLRTPGIDLEELKNRFEEMLASIQDPYINNLLERIFTAELKEKFFRAPAAKKIHHNYTGGLLEHTISVADLCLKACDLYTNLNRDLLLAGAIMHDIGKIIEYNLKVVPEYTVEGRMIGHIVIGSEQLNTVITDIRNEGLYFPRELEWMLKHMILSHHGMLEYGSPVKPLFPEALLLHTMDNLDAKMYVFTNKIDEDEGEDEFFTSYDGFHDQHFFKYRYNGQPDKND